MDWTGPLQARDVQVQGVVQGLYQSQQIASGFFQGSASKQNSSAYSGNDQAIKLHCRTENMVPNNLSSQNNVGSSNFQQPPLKSSVPVIGIGTTQHFVGQHPNIQLSSMNVQMASGMAMNTQPNSNVHIYSPVAPQLSTANPVQRSPNRYTTLDTYNNRPQKNCNSVQGLGFPGNKNCSRSKKLPLILPQYQPSNLQTHVPVPLNQVSNRFINPQQNSSCLAFPSGQNIQNQINNINSGSTTAMQNASNSVYSSSYTMPTYYATQVIPQATNTNLPPPSYAVSPIQINHGQFVLPQPVPNTSNQNVQNPELHQSSVSYSVQHVKTPDSVPVSRENNEVGGATDSIRGCSAENQPSNELAKSSVEALKNICNNLQIPGSIPLDKTSTPLMTSMVDDNTAKSSENVLDSFIKSKSMRESLELDKKKIIEMRKKILELQDNFKLKVQLYRSVVQKSKVCDSSVHNVTTSSTSQQLAPLPQATPQTFSPSSHDVTQYPISLPPHDNTQQIQGSSSLLLKSKNHLHPILMDLLKGTIDEEMVLKANVANANRNQSKQLFFQEKGSTGSVLGSTGAKSETSVNDMARTSKLSPGTSQTVCNQGSLTTTNVSLGFEQISALGKGQLTNTSAVSGGDLFNRFLLNKDKMGTSGTKILTNTQNTVSVQKPTESSQLSEKLAKEESRNSRNPSSPFVQQSKDHYPQTLDKSIKVWNNGNDISNSSSVAAVVPEAGEVQKSSFMGNSCTVGRTFSLEELETSLALWKKNPSTSPNDNLSENTKSTMGSSSLNREEDKEMECTMKKLPDAITHENSSITVGKNEPALSSVTSSLGQKFDAVSSSSAKSSEPQVAIVSPLILSKEGIQNDMKENDLSSMLEKLFSVIQEDSIHSLHKFVPTSDMDKTVKRTAYSPSDSCVTVKEVDSDVHQKTARSTEENGIKRAESGASCSYDPNQKPTGPLELKKNIPQPYSVDSFPPGINKDSSSPVSQNCASKTSRDFIEPQDTVLNENVLQISSVCTLVQGDAFYNSHIANIFNPSSKVEDNTSSEDQRPVSYHKEQQLSYQKRESEMNGDTSVGDAGLPSIDTLSKTIAEKLLSLPGLKKLQGGKVLGAMNERESEEEKTTELVNLTSGEELEQNTSCSEVCSRNLASGNEEVPGNHIADGGSALSMQDYVPSDENLLHSLSDDDLALRLPSDQLTELLKEFPYGIDDSKVLKKNEIENSAAKVNEIKEGQETQTCGQKSEANNGLDHIIITILNPQQMKELFPECSSQSSNKNQENNKLAIASKNTNESHIHTGLVESTDTIETAQKPAHHSFCCVQAWLALKYSVDPCKHMLAKEATFKQQLVQNLPSEIKEGSETNETSSNCQLNSQQQNIYRISNNTSEAENNQMLHKTFECRECDLQEKEKTLKEDKRLVQYPFLEKLELVKPKNKEQAIEELPEKVQIDGLCSPKYATLVSKSQERLCSGTDDSKEESISSACKRESSDKGRTPKEIVDGKSKSNTLQHSRIENKHNKKREKYKIKRDSSETHIIKGPNYPFKRGFKKHLANEWKNKTEEKLRGTSNVGKVDLGSKVHNNAQHSKEHLNRQIYEIERESENNKAVGKEQNISSNSEPSSKPVEYNKNSFSRPNLKKFAYTEERGSVWKYRRSLSDNIKTSKVPTFREQLRNVYKSHSSSKEGGWGAYKRDKCFTKTLSDKKSPCSRKSNTLTLQREQKKNYLNKVAFKQTERSICLTKLEQSPSKSVWHVKSTSVSEHPKDKKDCIPSTQQSEVMKPQMLEFKMCPEIVFRNLVSEEVSDAKKLPERERTPVSAVKSRREDWLNYIPPKRRKTDEKETQVDDRIPLDNTEVLLDKNEAIKNSNTIFETYKKMHLEKSRSLESSPIN